jgi:hypothetical protein
MLNSQKTPTRRIAFVILCLNLIHALINLARDFGLI